MSAKIIEVVAAVLLRPDGLFFLASRPEDKSYPGYWEFPGGKIEAGETPYAALVRELQEELGITITAATPWLTRVHHYTHATVSLRFYRVTAWEGEMEAREGQLFSWQHLGQETVSPMLPANTPIFRALALPPAIAITCTAERGQDAILTHLAHGLDPALGMIIVREPQMDRGELHRWVAQVRALAGSARVIVNTDPAHWPRDAADGVHLTSARLMACCERPDFAWVGASVHTLAELQQAAQLEVDYVLLSPIAATATHPGQAVLGWSRAAELIAHGWPMPVYALGGLSLVQLESARQHGAHGVALMRGAW